MIHQVPAYSQFLDVKEKNWRRRSCGIVSLKMVMAYWQAETASIAALIRTGRRLKAYTEKSGWTHKGLVRIAKKYGFDGQNFDWAEESSEKAFREMKRWLKLGPVIASVRRDLVPEGTGHLIVVTGIDGRRVFYNDPDSKTRKHLVRKIAIKRFVGGWKKRIIVIKPDGLRKKKNIGKV
jgi:ABC-type bacteriocin/lantibiotic exporter with double-glycine peptidase domain